MTAQPLIQSHQIGDSIALLSVASGAIVLTNDFGSSIHQGLANGLSPEQIARNLAETLKDQTAALTAVQTVLSTWEKAGLLLSSAPEFPDPVDYSPSVGTTLRFGGAGGNGQVLISDETLAEQVSTILGHMPPLPGPEGRALSAQRTQTGFAIFDGERPLSGSIPLDAARFVIIRELAEDLCGQQDVAAVCHAGCVADGNQALMICGDSGQGKSTLTLGLVAAGCSYLGDDHIPLHRDGRSALCFPTAAGVKATAWDLPEIIDLQTRFGLTPQSPRQGVRYLPLHRAQAPRVGEKRPIAALIFPHFHPDASFEMVRLTPEQALIQGLQAGSRLSRSHKSNLAPLCNFLNDVPAYALHYSSSSQFVPACLKLMSSLET